jgi:hypothetical protein
MCTMTNHRTTVRLRGVSLLVVAFVSTVADATTAIKQAELKNDRYRVRLVDVASIEVTERQAGSWRLSPSFTVLYSAKDPKLALRLSGSVRGYDCPTCSSKQDSRQCGWPKNFLKLPARAVSARPDESASRLSSSRMVELHLPNAGDVSRCAAGHKANTP